MPKKSSSKPGHGPRLNPSPVHLGQSDPNRTVSEINDTDEFVERVHKWFVVSEDATREFRRLSLESLDFLSNRQWPDETVSERANDGRPMITVNKTTATVMTVAGLQRQARTQLDLQPFEPNDVEATELMQVVYESIANRNRLHRKSSKVFTDCIATGLGFWRVSLDTRMNPAGDIAIDRINPLNIFWDPNFPDVEWEDAEWVIEAPWMTLDDAMATFPRFKDDIRSRFGEWLDSKIDRRHAGDTVGFDRRSFWDPQTQRMRLLHVWYKEIVRATVAISTDRLIESDPEIVERIRERQKDLPIEEQKFIFVERPVTFIRHAWILDDILLEDLEAPSGMDRLPYFPAVCYYFAEHPIGLTEFMKDPQREKNKRRSLITEIVQRSAHGGWMNKRDGGADRQQLEMFANGAVPVIEYDEEKPERIRQVEVPQAIVYLDQNSDADIRTTVNVNDELLGQTTQATVSGRAIEARQRGSTVSLESIFDDFDEAESELARFVVRMIQATMNQEEAQRILGALAKDERRMQQFSELPEIVGGIEAGEPGALSALDDIFDRTWNMAFDAVVSRKPFEQANRIGAYKQLIGMFEAVTNTGQPVPLEIIIESAKEAGLLDSRIARKWLEQVRAQERAAQQQAAGGELPPGANGAAPPRDLAALFGQGTTPGPEGA